MPPSASSKRPTRRSMAPVNAPLTWPNSSLSTSPAEMAAQLTLTRARAFRALRLWIARAISSLPVPVSPEIEHGGVGGGDLLDLAEHGQEGGAVADHLDEVVLAPDLLLQVHVLVLEPGLERRDLLVGRHVRDGEGDLVGDFLQELHVRLGVLPGRRARDRQRADARAARDQGHDDIRSDAITVGHVVRRVLSLRGEVVLQQGLLALEHLTHVALSRRHLEADREVGRPERGLEDEELEHVPVRVVKEDRGPLEGHHPAQGPGDRVEEGLAGEVRDEGVVDLEESAIALRLSAGLRPIRHGSYSISAGEPVRGVTHPACFAGTGS